MSLQCKVAGVPHRFPDPATRSNALASLHLNEEAILVPEPTNAFDTNAIKVLINGIHYGYIPKTMTGHIRTAQLTKMYVVEVSPEDKWSEIVLDQNESSFVALPHPAQPSSPL